MTPSVFDVTIWTGTKAQFIAETRTLLCNRQGPKALHTLNPEILMTAKRNPAFKAVLNRGHWNTVDGVGLQVALKHQGVAVPERLCGSDLIYDLARLCLENQRALYFIGGQPQRLAKALANLRAQFPGLVVEGLSPAPGQGTLFKEAPQIEADLRRLQPGVVAVCLGAPRQEQWIQDNLALLADCQVGVAGGLGGTVDFVSGEVTRAPLWIRKLGMEWAYRLAINPSRLKRQLSALPLFGLYALTGHQIRAR